MTSHENLAPVIFDCDGVLIDSQVIQCRIDAAELTRLGFPVTVEALARQFIGIAGAAARPPTAPTSGRSSM